MPLVNRIEELEKDQFKIIDVLREFFRPDGRRLDIFNNKLNELGILQTKPEPPENISDK